MGVVGLAIALVALMAAAVSPWATNLLQPDRKPIDEAAVEVAGRVKDRIAAKAKGQPYITPAEANHTNWASLYTLGVVVAGALAVSIGVVGLVVRHNGRLNAATVTVGTAAIILQYFLLIAAVLLFLLLVMLILWFLGFGN